MKPIHLFVIAALTLMPALVFAKGSPPTQEQASSLLEQSVRHELDAIGRLVGAIDTVLSSTEGGEVSGEAKAAHEKASRQYAAAKASVEGRDYVAGYKKLRAARKSVSPAVQEIYQHGISMKVSDVVAGLMEAASARVADIKDTVEGHGNAAAAEAYQAAGTHWDKAQVKYDAGETRAAYKQANACLNDLDTAISQTWSAAMD